MKSSSSSSTITYAYHFIDIDPTQGDRMIHLKTAFGAGAEPTIYLIGLETYTQNFSLSPVIEYRTVSQNKSIMNLDANIQG